MAKTQEYQVQRQGRSGTYLLKRVRRRLIRWLQEPELPEEPVSVSYGNTQPVVYDKDSAVNCYMDEYMMAMASAGAITLVGITTSSSIAPFNRHITGERFEQMCRNRQLAVNRARASGFQRLPDPVRGTKGHLQRPDSGFIADTKPIESEGSRMVVEQARRASVDKPLVLVMGGPLTLAADAYLLDPGIRDRIVVAWFGGRYDHMGDYNGQCDPWAALIVAARLRLWQFPSVRNNGCWPFSPIVPDCLLERLPDTPLRQWMLEKHVRDERPRGYDADSPPAIALVRPDYVRSGRRMSVRGWVRAGERGDFVPALKFDPQGEVVVVTNACQSIATQEWWRAIANPRAYAGKPNLAALT